MVIQGETKQYVESDVREMVGDYSMKELSTAGNLLGDRGILPVLEVARL